MFSSPFRHRSDIKFCWAVSCSCLLFFAHIVPAQVTPSHKSTSIGRSYKRISIGLSAKRLPYVRKSARTGRASTERTRAARERLVAFADTAGPLRPSLEFERQSRPVFSTQHPESYRVPVNLKLLAPGTDSTASWQDMQVIFAPVEFARVMSARAEFSPAEPVVQDEPVNRGDDLEYYAHHVPVVGPIMQHVLNQSKAHPRLTRVFEVIQPQLF